MYVDKQSAGRLVVVRRPLLVGGEGEGMGRLKGECRLSAAWVPSEFSSMTEIGIYRPQVKLLKFGPFVPSN